MRAVACVVLRWVSDLPVPGWVEARIEDAHGTIWTFEDKSVMFERDQPITKHSRFPVSGIVRCHVVSTISNRARELVTISTAPVEAVGGVDTFEVDRSQLLTVPDRADKWP